MADDPLDYTREIELNDEKKNKSEEMLTYLTYMGGLLEDSCDGWIHGDIEVSFFSQFLVSLPANRLHPSAKRLFQECVNEVDDKLTTQPRHVFLIRQIVRDAWAQ